MVGLLYGQDIVPKTTPPRRTGTKLCQFLFLSMVPMMVVPMTMLVPGVGRVSWRVIPIVRRVQIV